MTASLSGPYLMTQLKQPVDSSKAIFASLQI